MSQLYDSVYYRVIRYNPIVPIKEIFFLKINVKYIIIFFHQNKMSEKLKLLKK